MKLKIIPLILCITAFIVLTGFILTIFSKASAQGVDTGENPTFLVISEIKDIFYTLSLGEQEKLNTGTADYLKEAMAEERVLKLYSIPGWNRRVSIEQFESLNDLYNHFENVPLYPFIDFEVYPLRKIEMDDEIVAQAKPDSKKMKFLVINEAKEIWSTLSVEEQKKIEDENPFSPGDLLDIYSVPGWDRAVAIEQYDNIESLYKHFEEDTYYPFADFEVYPLKEIDPSEL